MKHPTNAEVKLALKKSISKWRYIASGMAADHGPDDCALCEMFMPPGDTCKTDCLGCPISVKVGAKYCSRTPYREWVLACEVSDYADTPTKIRLARKMLKFLIGLHDHFFGKAVK